MASRACICVKDPTNVFNDKEDGGRLRDRGDPAECARDSGYRQAGTELWLALGDDLFIYQVHGTQRAVVITRLQPPVRLVAIVLPDQFPGLRARDGRSALRRRPGNHQLLTGRDSGYRAIIDEPQPGRAASSKRRTL